MLSHKLVFGINFVDDLYQTMEFINIHNESTKVQFLVAIVNKQAQIFLLAQCVVGSSGMLRASVDMRL